MNDQLDEVVVNNILRDLRDGELDEEFIESISQRNPAYTEALRRYRLENEHLHNVAGPGGEGKHTEVDTGSVERKSLVSRFIDRLRRLLQGR